MLGLILGLGVPVAYLATWTLTARTLYRRYHPIEGEKRLCPRRGSHPEQHRTGGDRNDMVCTECSSVNRQWWQERSSGTTAHGLSDGHLAWDCVFQSVIPPLTLIIFIMYKVVTANPPQSPREAKAREDELTARVKELETLNADLSKATGA